MQRRNFLKIASVGSASIVLHKPPAVYVSKPSIATIEIDPKPLFELSKHLYMQFMEPLGTTDSSVEAAWDHKTDNW
jgi:hypothetical protein